MNDTDTLYFLAFFPIIGFCIKLAMDAWSKTNRTSNIYAISSIIQYSLMTMYLVMAVYFIVKYLNANPTVATKNLKWFCGALGFLLIANVAIITLYSLYYPTLQYGYITPSISESINNYIMIPLWILIIYNMHTLTDCAKRNMSCSPIISFLTLAIIGFGLMQCYLISNSFRMVQRWPTDDIYFAPSPTQTS